MFPKIMIEINLTSYPFVRYSVKLAKSMDHLIWPASLLEPIRREHSCRPCIAVPRTRSVCIRISDQSFPSECTI